MKRIKLMTSDNEVCGGVPSPEEVVVLSVDISFCQQRR